MPPVPHAAAAGAEDRLSLLGGPLHRAGRRVGLVRGDANPTALGLAIGCALWSVAACLAWVEGAADALFSMSGVGVHVRLLVAIPLLFVCESMLEPRLRGLADGLQRSGVIPPSTVPAWRTELARTARLKEAWLPEVLCLLGAVALTGWALAAPAEGRALGVAPWTDAWYGTVCLTVLRFLLLRWLWRMALWVRFLWRLVRLDLRLVPTHPDGQAGLGYLQIVHEQFVPLVAALSAIHAAALAQEIHDGRLPLEGVLLPALVVVVLEALVFLGPLLLVGPRLHAVRIAGLEAYMPLASRYVDAFERKWLHGVGRQEELLGTADLQSLADLQNSVAAVQQMPRVPVGRPLLTHIVAASLLPLAPLVLLEYPLMELTGKIIERLVGF